MENINLRRHMSRYSSFYQFHHDLEMRDAGYEYEYPNIPAISWSEEDSPQWKYLGANKLFKESNIPCKHTMAGDIDD
jgi:hypothetical protein